MSVQGQPTYTPRAVMFDLKGSAGAMPLQRGTAPPPLSVADALSHVPTVTTWSGPATTVAAEPIQHSAFMQALYAEVPT